MNSDKLDKLNLWKRDLNAVKAGEKPRHPYDGIVRYREMPDEDQLFVDILLDVLDALTEKK